MRSDWRCYVCGGSDRVRRRRVTINRQTTECIFLCEDDAGEYQAVVQEMRALLTHRSPPQSSGLGEGF